MSEWTIRATEPGDAAALQALYAQPSCQASTLQLPFPSVQLWQDRLAKPDPLHHSLVALDGAQIVGQIGVLLQARPRRRHAAGIGMAVSESHRRRGVGDALMREALALCDKWLGVSRVELEVFADNAAAIGLYRRHGFELEGVARAYALRDGELVDTHFMARLRPRAT